MLWVAGIGRKKEFAFKHVEFEVHPGKMISVGKENRKTVQSH